METKVNLAEKLALLDAPFQPGIVGALNDYKLAVVKVHGEFVWHKHDDTDDFFLVLSGRLTIQLRDRDVELEAGELFVVPRGVEHCPRADRAGRGAADRAAGSAGTPAMPVVTSPQRSGGSSGPGRRPLSASQKSSILVASPWLRRRRDRP